MHCLVKMYVMHNFFAGQHFYTIWHLVVQKSCRDSTGCRFILVLLWEGDFMTSLSGDKQTDVIDAFNTTRSYLDDILYI